MIPRAGGAASQGQASPAVIDGVFRALSDPTRRDVLLRLSAHSASASDLAATYDMALPSFMEHLKVLERAGLIERIANAQWRTLTMRTEPLDEASGWVEKHRREWNQRIDALEEHLKTMIKKEEQ